MTQDGDEPLLAELKQQDFQPEKFGSGHAETNNGNDSIILFESAVEKPIAVILPNTTIIKENSEETIETDQGVYTYDLLLTTYFHKKKRIPNFHEYFNQPFRYFFQKVPIFDFQINF